MMVTCDACETEIAKRMPEGVKRLITWTVCWRCNAAGRLTRSRGLA